MTTVSNCVGSERLADLSDPSLRAGYQRFLVDPFATARKDIGQFQNEVSAAAHAHESFRLLGEFEEPLGRAYRNDVVLLSVNHKNRNMNVTDREIGAELIEHQPTYRKKRVVRRGDIQRRQIRRFENERGRDAGPQRCAHHDDAIAAIASCARLAISGFAILHQAALRRRTGRAARGNSSFVVGAECLVLIPPHRWTSLSVGSVPTIRDIALAIRSGRWTSTPAPPSPCIRDN